MNAKAPDAVERVRRNYKTAIPLSGGGAQNSAPVASIAWGRFAATATVTAVVTLVAAEGALLLNGG